MPNPLPPEVLLSDAQLEKAVERGGALALAPGPEVSYTLKGGGVKPEHASVKSAASVCTTAAHLRALIVDSLALAGAPLDAPPKVIFKGKPLADADADALDVAGAAGAAEGRPSDASSCIARWEAART